MSYKFNPLSYGFEPIENFSELAEARWYGANTFIKVLENGGGTFGRKVYWYVACTLNSINGDDDRINFYNHSYDANDSPTKNFDLGSSPRIVYDSLIGSDEFAIELLKNLFGTTKNDSVQTYGKQRLERNINEAAKK